jgi:hypothetical protein
MRYLRATVLLDVYCTLHDCHALFWAGMFNTFNDYLWSGTHHDEQRIPRAHAISGLLQQQQKRSVHLWYEYRYKTLRESKHECCCNLPRECYHEESSERKRNTVRIKRTVFWYRSVLSPFDKPLDRPIKYCITVEGSTGLCKERTETHKWLNEHKKCDSYPVITLQKQKQKQNQNVAK